MIDRATVDKIIDAADIVDVVSDFVALKHRGANYVGLCPFHNDRRPSFYVSRSKGICKCFSCGKGGSAVNFIMEHEQLSYPEALRYLAKKYHIDIEERELTDEERAAQSERESQLVINEFAMRLFEQQLHETREGQEIGLSYFRERGFTDESIRKFHLGYSPESSHFFYQSAIKAGYSREMLLAVGLCIDDNRGGGYDRFRGRVMFPIFNIAGKVVAFGGRTLKQEAAKYVNSPESAIYNKRNELYGLFQAKRAIAKQGKCFIVEGYADVISMHQAGFENVIASSGTALTEGHIHKIHRFTENVTELFDGDAAGVHAALRGVDLLLKQGLNIKVLLLPEDEDPDSFARSHSATEIQNYINEHERDFIRFKTDVLLKGSKNDPIKRATAIADIVKSIAVIPSEITQSVYAKECSTLLGIKEEVILKEIKKDVLKIKNEEYKHREREKSQRTSGKTAGSAPAAQGNDAQRPTAGGDLKIEASSPENHPAIQSPAVEAVPPHETDLMRYIAKYGMCYLCETDYGDGNLVPTSLIEYVHNQFSDFNLKFTCPTYIKIYNLGIECLPEFYRLLEDLQQQIKAESKRLFDEGTSRFREEGIDNLDEIEQKENALSESIEASMNVKMEDFRKTYLEKRLCSHADDKVRETALELVSEKHQLSKIHTQFAVIATELDRLPELAKEAINNWRNAIVTEQMKSIQNELKNADKAKTQELLQHLQDLSQQRKKLAKLTGERVVNPR